MIFVFTRENSSDAPQNHREANVGMEFEAVELSDIFQNFEQFLRGCGFYFDGRIGIVEDGE